MSRVTVLGANGFLGSHLVDALVREGHGVTAFDRFAPEDVRVFEATDIRIVPGDFMNPDDVASAIHGSDVVMHALSTTNPATAVRNPVADMTTNVAPTVSLLQQCVDAGIRRVDFLSSGGAIYGPNTHRPHHEDDAALPVSPYGIGKLAIERYLEYFRVSHGLDYAIFRVSNPFGTRQRPGRLQGLIPIALRAIRDGIPVVRMGDGSMVRDYIYVEDVSGALARLMDRELNHRLYNVGSGRGRTVSEILETLRAVTGTDFEIEARPRPATFVDYSTLDVTRFTDEHGPIEVTDFHVAIDRTWGAIKSEQ